MRNAQPQDQAGWYAARRMDTNQSGDMAYEQLSDDEAWERTKQAYKDQKANWAPVYSMDDMLSSLANTSSPAVSKPLVAKLCTQLSEGRSHRQPRRGSALPRLLVRSYRGSVADRMLVVARTDEDVSWLSVFLSDIPHTVYQAGWTEEKRAKWVGPLPQHKAAPHAKETNVYLQYIVDNYDRLPETVVFMHAHRHGWHMKDKVPLLQRLRWGQIGFANLRHQGFKDWDCGSPFKRKFFPCGWEGAIVTPRQPFTKTFFQQPQPGPVARYSMNVHRFWRVLFQDELGPLPELIYTQCCAEFVVSRDRILAHPKAFYKRILAKINSYNLKQFSYELALAFEYSWHIIFGEPPVSPPVAECDMLTCSAEQHQ